MNIIARMVINKATWPATKKQEQSAKRILFHKISDETEVKLNIITTHIFSRNEGSV